VADVAPIVVFRAAYPPWRGSENDARDSEGSFDRKSADYWRGRERAERAAAKQARSPLARAVHQELAQEYAARVRGLEGSTTSKAER
jgi:hypothetical protein